MRSRFLHLALVAVLPLSAARCGGPSATPENGGDAEKAVATPVYDQKSGRLTELVSDKDGDGKDDTWAVMDGTTLKTIRIDLNGDGKPDRTEYYATLPDGTAQIERAEEVGSGGVVTRREQYRDGTIQRVEEDTDADGRMDKWEYYEAGSLRRVDLDLDKDGRADRRLLYGPDGQIEQVEADPDGDGVFEPLDAERTK